MDRPCTIADALREVRDTILKCEPGKYQIISGLQAGSGAMTMTEAWQHAFRIGDSVRSGWETIPGSHVGLGQSTEAVQAACRVTSAVPPGPDVNLGLSVHAKGQRHQRKSVTTTLSFGENTTHGATRLIEWSAPGGVGHGSPWARGRVCACRLQSADLARRSRTRASRRGPDRRVGIAPGNPAGVGHIGRGKQAKRRRLTPAPSASAVRARRFAHRTKRGPSSTA
jgi:hypothetical protein